LSGAWLYVAESESYSFEQRAAWITRRPRNRAAPTNSQHIDAAALAAALRIGD
jgi:hypothetical protein